MKKITQKLIKLMSDHGLSQADLAKMAGVSEASVSAWMRGAVPRRRYLLKIANALNIDIVSLENDELEIKGKEKMPMANGDSILDAYVDISSYEILANLSDLIDKLDETTDEKDAAKQIINELVLTLIRGINTLSSCILKISKDRNEEFKSEIYKISDKMIIFSYALGQCARYIPPEKIKTIIQNLRRYSSF